MTARHPDHAGMQAAGVGRAHGRVTNTQIRRTAEGAARIAAIKAAAPKAALLKTDGLARF